MGVFSFKRGVGTSLWSRKSNQIIEVIPTIEDVELEKASLLRRFIRNLGLACKGFIIETIREQVHIKGSVNTQGEREKIILALGNVSGVKTVIDELAVEYPDQPAVFHEIKNGDSLSKIATSYYGDPNLKDRLLEANSPLVKEPKALYPGQVIRVPSLAIN